MGGGAAEVALLSLSTDDSAREGRAGELGLSVGMTDGHVVLHNPSHPTLPDELLEMAPEGVAVVDAPKCRGAPPARQGDILFLVGAPDGAVDMCQPVLEASGEHDVIGGPGAG